ncbi:MAG: hypothetical protein GYA23_11995 [Methanomicrobiales archaeon]|nr:hypothetical protein [Methanomicrobiales archaeon]
MTAVVDHKTQRLAWHHKHHSYLVDTGSPIEIQQIEVSRLFENCLLDPPFPETSFFEIEIEEVKKDGKRTFAFTNIWPVRAQRNPDLHILRFRIKRGGWNITERIYDTTPHGEKQWLYTDDFNILFLSSGGRHDAEMLISLITGKLDSIARSIMSGSRIPSEFENQLSCRSAFGTIFSNGVDGAFRDSVIYKQHASAISGELDEYGLPVSGTEIAGRHGHVSVSSQQMARLQVDLDTIDDLQDLSWLTDNK